MRRILPPEMTFEALSNSLASLGWSARPIPGLRPPLKPGEPELARFENGAEQITYSFNPVVGLRVLDGAVTAKLSGVTPATITAWLRDDDPRARARGCLAAAELHLTHLRPQVADAIDTLPNPLRSLAQTALDRLAPLPDALPSGAFSALPRSLKLQTLRHLLAERPRAVRALLPHCWSDDPELAATASIAAARIGAREAYPDVRRADLSPLGPTRAEGEVFTALRKACLATLEGKRPTDGTDPRNRFWRQLLGQPPDDGQGSDMPGLVIHALTTPLPVTDLPDQDDGFVTIPALPHWLGLPGSALENPVRRVTPNPFRIAARVITQKGSDAPLLTDDPERILKETDGTLRLPTVEEWECTLRGPDARPFPWGVDPHPPDPALSPWGAICSGNPEWALRDGTLVLCGTDRTQRPGWLRLPEHGEKGALRPILA